MSDTVLVVEDEVPLRKFLSAALHTAGFRVIEAGTLAEAEQLERAAGDQPLADSVLPEGRVRRVRAALERLDATDEAIAALARRTGEAAADLT